MKIEAFLEQYGARYFASRANGTVTALSGLTNKKRREEARCFLAEGVKLSQEALAQAEVPALVVSETAAEAEKPELLRLVSDAAGRGVPILALSEPAFLKLTTEKSPQGVIAVVRFPNRHTSCAVTSFDSFQNGRRLLMLYHLRDPGNLGTVLRSAAALGIDGIVTVSCADLYNEKTLRASMGAVFRTAVFDTDDPLSAITAMQKAGRRVLAASVLENAYSLGNFLLRKTDCLVIGNEGHGISPEVEQACDGSVRIPMTPGSESLNAAAAAAILMWEYYRAFP